MRHAVWFVAGTAAGAYLSARSRRALESLSVEGVHDRLTGWFAGARVLQDELRLGTAEREAQLRHALSRVPDAVHGTPDNVRQLPSRPESQPAPPPESEPQEGST